MKTFKTQMTNVDGQTFWIAQMPQIHGIYGVANTKDKAIEDLWSKGTVFNVNYPSSGTVRIFKPNDTVVLVYIYSLGYNYGIGRTVQEALHDYAECANSSITFEIRFDGVVATAINTLGHGHGKDPKEAMSRFYESNCINNTMGLLNWLDSYLTEELHRTSNMELEVRLGEIRTHKMNVEAMHKTLTDRGLRIY